MVEADDPIGCVGYAYALERLAAEKGPDEIAAVQRILPPGVNATRCLKVHSGAGADVKHVTDNVEVLIHLSARERAAAAKACYETARLFYAPRVAGPKTDRDIQALLSLPGNIGARP